MLIDSLCSVVFPICRYIGHFIVHLIINVIIKLPNYLKHSYVLSQKNQESKGSKLSNRFFNEQFLTNNF